MDVVFLVADRAAFAEARKFTIFSVALHARQRKVARMQSEIAVKVLYDGPTFVDVAALAAIAELPLMGIISFVAVDAIG
ncbi:MAG: hypothetical protein AB7N80_05670 [Bdellovibrionales bacterium]